MALTGTEAVADGVQAFKPPEAQNAKIVLALMGTFFASIFLGMSFLAGQLGIVPDPTEQTTVISQITSTIVGAGSPFHYLVQIATAVILMLAANTSFADFPRLSNFLARDGFLPRVFQFRGDRLAFNAGIILLASVAIVLIIGFGGSVAALIPLYTVGVFIAFTLSQSGMVRRWLRLRDTEHGWRHKALINGIGAATTAVVAVEVAASKFFSGAWIVLLLIPIIIAVMLFIHRQYASTAEQLAVKPGVRLPGPHREERVIIPVPGINRAVVQAINVARSIAPDVLAVLVSDEPDEASKVREDWELSLPDVPLVIVESPYRALVGPLLAYLDVLDDTWPSDKAEPITFVVIPEFVAHHWWEQILFNQSARRLRRALLGRKHTGRRQRAVPTRTRARSARARLCGSRDHSGLAETLEERADVVGNQPRLLDRREVPAARHRRPARDVVKPFDKGARRCRLATEVMVEDRKGGRRLDPLACRGREGCQRLS